MKLRSGRETPITEEIFFGDFNKLMKKYENKTPFKMDDNFYNFCLDLCRFTDKNRFYIHENNNSIKRFRQTLYKRTEYFLDRIRADEYIYDLTNGGDEAIVHFLLSIRELAVNPYWKFPDTKLFRSYKFI